MALPEREIAALWFARKYTALLMRNPPLKLMLSEREERGKSGRYRMCVKSGRQVLNNLTPGRGKVKIELGKILESSPKFGPAEFWRTADVNVGSFEGFFIVDAIGIPSVRSEAAGFEIFVHELFWKTHDDHRLGRRITVATLPG